MKKKNKCSTQIEKYRGKLLKRTDNTGDWRGPTKHLHQGAPKQQRHQPSAERKEASKGYQEEHIRE